MSTNRFHTLVPIALLVLTLIFAGIICGIISCQDASRDRKEQEAYATLSTAEQLVASHNKAWRIPYAVGTVTRCGAENSSRTSRNPAGNRYITRHYTRYLAAVTFGDGSIGVAEVSADIYALLREGDQITITHTHPTSLTSPTLFVGTAYQP